MQINDLNKYGQDEFNYFRCLSAAEKIAFVDSVCTTGVEETLNHFISLEGDLDLLKEPIMMQTVSFEGVGTTHAVIYEDEMCVYSDSLKAIRFYIKKMFEDGNILVRLNVRKPKEIQERFYIAYEILPNTNPLCLS